MITGYTRTIVRVGIDNTHKNSYLVLANPTWSSIEAGKEYKLSFQFDAESIWHGTFTAVDFNGTVALMNIFSKPKFLQDIAVKQSLSIYYNDTFVTKLPLSGTYEAVRSMTQCQDKLNQLTGTVSSSKSSSPFGSDSARPSDPFGNGNVRPAVIDPFSR